MVALSRGGSLCPMLRLLLLLFTILLFKCNPIHATILLPDNIEETFQDLLEIFDGARGQEFLEFLKQNNDNDDDDTTIKNEEDFVEPHQYFRTLDRIFGLECLRGLIRPNMNQQLAHASTDAYDTIGACLTDREGFVPCGPTTADGDNKKELISFTNQLDASGAEFRYQSIGPEQLLGVFWLKYDGPWSSIMSFAQSKDGGILSPGVWSRDDDGIDYRTRVAGDRIWSMSIADDDLSDGFNATVFENMQRHDLIYEYVVTEGTVEDPRKVQIFPTLNMPDSCFRFHFGPCMEWYIYTDITLLTDPAEKGNYTNSVVWRRHTTGIKADRTGNYTYPLIQIIDGNGQPIEPAYSDWLVDESHPTAGDQPNINWFRSVREDAPLTSAAQLC